MSGELHMWEIVVTHPVTKERVRFLGQGTTVLEAVTDGAKNAGEKFRPDQSGASGKPGEKGGPNRCAVRRATGELIFKTLSEFEAGKEPENHATPLEQLSAQPS